MNSRSPVIFQVWTRNKNAPRFPQPRHEWMLFPFKSKLQLRTNVLYLGFQEPEQKKILGNVWLPSWLDVDQLKGTLASSMSLALGPPPSEGSTQNAGPHGKRQKTAVIFWALWETSWRWFQGQSKSRKFPTHLAWLYKYMDHICTKKPFTPCTCALHTWILEAYTLED